jgi:hypothetical protein
MKPFTVILLVIIILSGDFMAGIVSSHAPTVAIAGCNNPSSLEQCGTASCTPVGVPFNNCSITVTFSPSFLTIPKFASAQMAGCHSPECHFETQAFPLGSLTFQSDNGETWINMPVAKTELYGNTNHQVAILTTASMVEAEFSVGCLTGSSSATALLRPEFSTDGGGTWTELSQNAGGLDILVDASDCSFSASPAFAIGPAGINSGASGQSIILRVVGVNGGGVGDSPVFNNVELTFFAQFGEMYLLCIQGISPFTCGTSAISKTQMIILVTRMAPAVSGLATAILVNWMASE